MQIVKKNLSELTRNTKNVRRHSNKQIAEYKRSLEKFGQVRPMVIDEKGVIIAGNGMYDALIEMGRTEADCYVVNGLSENDKIKLMLADNKVFELGITDLENFEDLIAGLNGDFDIPGYDDDLLNLIIADTKKVTESIVDYGKIDNSDEYKYNPDSTPNYGNYGQPANTEPVYSPVRKDVETGEFVPSVPVKVEPRETPREDLPVEERPYVICPKCGEKIWL